MELTPEEKCKASKMRAAAIMKKQQKDKNKLLMADIIIDYVLADFEDPPTAEELLKFVENLGGSIAGGF